MSEELEIPEEKPEEIPEEKGPKIPEEIPEPQKKKGRPRKVTEEFPEPQKKKGRPRKVPEIPEEKRSLKKFQKGLKNPNTRKEMSQNSKILCEIYIS